MNNNRHMIQVLFELKHLKIISSDNIVRTRKSEKRKRKRRRESKRETERQLQNTHESKNSYLYT